MKPVDFDRCICLNLDRRPDRWSGFQERLAKVKDWPFGTVERYSAVDGFSVPPPPWWRERPGAWGCMASYWRLLEETLEEGGENILMFEDDAMFKPNFAGRAQLYFAALPDDWQIAYLGGLHWEVYRNPPTCINRCVIKPYRMTGTHAWAVRTSFIPTLLGWLKAEFLPKDIGLQQVDQRLGMLQQTQRFNIYAPLESFVGQVENISDISGCVVGPCYWELLSDVTDRMLRETTL